VIWAIRFICIGWKGYLSITALTHRIQRLQSVNRSPRRGAVDGLWSGIMGVTVTNRFE
jgi:hypothetical protein